jgi:hypothetical protein
VGHFNYWKALFRYVKRKVEEKCRFAGIFNKCSSAKLLTKKLAERIGVPLGSSKSIFLLFYFKHLALFPQGDLL